MAVLDPKVCATGDCDPHQFSSAILRFIGELKKIAPGINFSKFLELAATLPNSGRVSTFQLFKSLKELAPPQSNPAADALLIKYHMDTLAEFDDLTTI